MSRGRLFGTLCSLAFLLNLGRIGFAPLLEPLMATYAVGPGTAGLVASLVWFGTAVVRIPVGYVLTRVPRRRVILAAGGLLAVTATGAALAPSIEVLAAFACGIGAASGVYFVAANPLVSELFPDRVGRALGLHGVATQLAAVVAAPLVGVVLLFDGPRAVFVGLAAAAVVATAVLARTAGAVDAGRVGGVDRDLRSAARTQWRVIATGVVVLGTGFFVWSGVFNFYVSYLVAEKAVSPGTAGAALTATFAAGVPAFFVGGRLADRFPPVPLLLGVLLAFCAGLVGLTLVSGALAVVAASLAIGFLVHGAFPAMDTYMLSTLPDEHRGSGYAIYSGLFMAVSSGGPGLVGGLTEAGLGFSRVFQGLAVGLAAVLLAVGGLQVAGRVPGGPPR